MKIAHLALLLLIGLVGSAFAAIEPPAMIIDGLNAYAKYDNKAALDIWLKGSLLDSTVAVGRLTAIEGTCGRMIGFETIRVLPVSASLLRVYLLVKYEKSPAVFAFDCYQPNANWIVAKIDYDVKLEVAAP